MILEKHADSKDPHRDMLEDTTPFVSEDLPPYPTRGTENNPAAEPSKSRDLVAFGPPVNNVFIKTRNENISGDYCIDPTQDRLEGWLAQYAKWGRCCGMKGMNAAFRSRHGNCSLKLATTGVPSSEAQKVHISAQTRTGNIFLDVVAIQDKRRINLDVYSRKGNIVLLVPRNFFGFLHLKSRHGTVKILPAFRSMAPNMTATRGDTVLFVGGSPTLIDMKSANLLFNFCKLASRSGDIAVGVSGEDDIVPGRSL